MKLPSNLRKALEQHALSTFLYTNVPIEEPFVKKHSSRLCYDVQAYYEKMLNKHHGPNASRFQVKMPPRFELEQTGGGCTAWRCKLDSEAYLLITDEGCVAPSVWSQRVIAGLYKSNEFEPTYTFEFAHFSDFIGFITSLNF